MQMVYIIFSQLAQDVSFTLVAHLNSTWRHLKWPGPTYGYWRPYWTSQLSRILKQNELEKHWTLGAFT